MHVCQLLTPAYRAFGRRESAPGDYPSGVAGVFLI
jgi:hypothetical protein